MRLSMLAAGLAALVVLSPSLAHACSQCMCGTPFPSDVLGGVVPMQLTYGLEDRYLSKENGLEEEPGVEEEREHRIGAFGLWRPTNRIALLGRLPYNFKEITETPDGGPAVKQREQGLGDAELHLLGGLLNTGGKRPTILGMVLGVSAPTGSSNQKDDTGERLDEHLQPGSGAWSGTAGLNVVVSDTHGMWDASVLGRANGTNSHDHRYGNALLFNAGYTTRPWKTLQFLAQINGRSAKRDRLEDGTFDENSGGTVSYAAPGVRWLTGMGLMVEGAVQIPFQQSLNGIQTEHTTARLAITMSH